MYSIIRLVFPFLKIPRQKGRAMPKPKKPPSLPMIKVIKRKSDGQHFASMAYNRFNINMDGLVLLLKMKNGETFSQLKERVRKEMEEEGVTSITGLDGLREGGWSKKR